MKHSLSQQYKHLFKLKQCIKNKIRSFTVNSLTYFHHKLFTPISNVEQLKANTFRALIWISAIANSISGYIQW